MKGIQESILQQCIKVFNLHILILIAKYIQKILEIKLECTPKRMVPDEGNCFPRLDVHFFT